LKRFHISPTSSIFSSILLTDVPFETAELYTNNLVGGDNVDTTYTKQFKAIVPLAFKNGEINEKMNWYYGPDYKLLKRTTEILKI
jgi:YidC/Oxa1 family membrane protein insertase